jgi:protein-disulfide isomerase
MRPMGMNRLFAAIFVLSIAAAASAQSAMGASPQNPATQFKDTSMLKPPAGAKVAIVEWEDLECPACAHAFPQVHTAVKQYNIPLVRYDFPLKMHIWSHDGAIIARYLQDKVSPDLATEYRREVFASQVQIASKDDLHNFTLKFFATNHQQYPFVIDPSGQFVKEVDAEEALGEKAGLGHTPTIVVVTDHKGWIEVLDVSDLYNAIDTALAATKTEGGTAKSVSPHHTATIAGR